MSQAFTEEATPPTAESIAAALGVAAPVWAATVAPFEGVGATVEWRYYRDGGWLAKATKHSQTIAWLRVEPGHLRVTFYFAARLRDLLLNEAALAPRELAAPADSVRVDTRAEVAISTSGCALDKLRMRRPGVESRR